MKPMAWIGCATLAAALFATAAFAGPSERWLHVRVEERGERSETVRVNVPVSLAEAIIPLINEKECSQGLIKFSGCEFSAVQLRAVRDAVAKAPDGEYVTVESDDEHVRVAKKAGWLTVDVTSAEKSAKSDGKSDGKRAGTVHVKVPMPVVDALLSGPADGLDLLAAVRALGAEGDGELVAVTDESATVRVWVDALPAGK